MNKSFAQCVVALSALALVLAGCATASKDVATTYVSPVQYQSYDCDQIAAEVQRVQVRVTQLGGRLDQAATNDALITTVGIVLFWPILFALGGTKQQEAEYSRLKGEYDALQQQAVMKKCPGAVQSTTASAPAPQPATPASERAPTLVPVSTTGDSTVPAASAASPAPAVSAPVPPAPVPASATAPAAAVAPTTAVVPVPAAPAIAGSSKFMFNAERFAKGVGCELPVATMTSRTATSEAFSIACSNRARLSVHCADDNTCREAQ